MIRINLLSVREVEQASSRRKEIVLAGGLIVLTCLGVVIAYLLQGGRVNEVDTELQRATKALEQTRQYNQELEKSEQQKKEIEAKVQVVRLLTSPRRRASSVHILDDLSVSMPESLWLTDFVENKGVAKISGKAADNQTIASFAHNLSGSAYFRNVEIRETVQEVPTTTEPRRRGAKAGAVDTALAPPVTKFLIEARINYVPGLPEESAQTGAEEAQEKKDGRGPPATKAPE
jgi:type IV pilus assembly protein PilN